MSPAGQAGGGGEDTIPFGTVRTHGYNADDPKQIDVATVQTKQRVQTEADDLALVLSTEQGRRFVTRILQLTGINALSDPDPVQTQRAEGARSVGIELCRILNEHSVHAYPQLLVEAALAAEQARREREIALNEREAAEKRGVFPWLARTLGYG